MLGEEGPNKKKRGWEILVSRGVEGGWVFKTLE